MARKKEQAEPEASVVVEPFSVAVGPEGVAVVVNREVFCVEDAVALRAALDRALVGVVR